MNKTAGGIIKWVVIGLVGAFLILFYYVLIEDIVSHFHLWFLRITSALGLLTIICGIIWGAYSVLIKIGVLEKKTSYEQQRDEWERQGESLPVLYSRRSIIYFLLGFIGMCAMAVGLVFITKWVR